MSIAKKLINKYCNEFNCNPKFLWQLKLTRMDYNELKTELREFFAAPPLKFVGIEEDIALYCAEWYRREYSNGQVSFDGICDSICDNIDRRDFEKKAKKGRELLGLDLIHTCGIIQETTQYLYSLCYQGGFPLNYIAQDIHDSSGWRGFFKKLAWHEQDFNIVAGNRATLAQSNSLHEFAKILQYAADKDNPEYLPFCCKETCYNCSQCMKWWDIIKRNFAEGKCEKEGRLPFTSTWKIVIDDINKNIQLMFHVTGPKELSDEFVNNHNIQDYKSVSFALRVNNTSYHLAEYDSRHHCRRDVKKILCCRAGDNVSLYINETGEVLWQRCLDFSDPKLVSLIDEWHNIFTLCSPSCLQTESCRIIASEYWECTNPNVTTEDYSFWEGEERLVVISSFPVPTNSITLENKVTNETKEICYNSPLKWTGISGSSALSLNIPVIEQVFNANTAKFTEGEDDNEKPATVNILFARKNSQIWERKPSFGEIRAKLDYDNQSVDPVRFINVGELSIDVLNSTRTETVIQIQWDHGSITSKKAQEIEPGKWKIVKSELQGRYVEFNFVPTNGSSFTLHLTPPFYDFCIYDRNDKQIENGAIVPIIDLNSYRYYLHLRNDEKLLIPSETNPREDYYKYTDADRTNGNFVKKHYFNDPVEEGTIPYESPLSSLFLNGSDQIIELLEQSMSSIPHARVNISFNHGGRRMECCFKDFPYHLCQKQEQKDIYINIDSTGLPEYNGNLLALPLDSPNDNPIQLERNGYAYVLPNEKCNNASKWLVYGNLCGYILPLLVDLSCNEVNPETRKERREIFLSELSKELHQSELFSPTWVRAIAWFDQISKGQIPGTSILELVAISEDRYLLTKFALQLYLLKGGDNMSTLKYSLIDFQQQMPFLWNWAAGVDMKYLEDLFTESVLDNLRKESVLVYLNMEFLLPSFFDWFKTLQTESVPEAKLHHPDIHRFGQETYYEGVPSKEAQRAFLSFRNNHERTDNSRWLRERREFSERLERENLSDYLNSIGIQHDEYIRREIRKSIIYGLKFKIDEYEI